MATKGGEPWNLANTRMSGTSDTIHFRMCAQVPRTGRSFCDETRKLRSFPPAFHGSAPDNSQSRCAVLKHRVYGAPYGEPETLVRGLDLDVASISTSIIGIASDMQLQTE